MADREVVLCNPVRTPIGTYGGTLENTPATELGAVVIREVLPRFGLAPERVQALVMGQVVQAGSKMNPARQAGIASEAGEIMAGYVDCAIVGGMENMHMAPYLLPQGRWSPRCDNDYKNVPEAK